MTHQVGIESIRTTLRICFLKYSLWRCTLLKHSICCPHHISGIPANLHIGQTRCQTIPAIGQMFTWELRWTSP